MSIIHDGAAFTRIPKVREIAKHPIAMSVVKVCWEGKHPERNCGTCEKCLRTRLSFAAVGEPAPPCFDGPLDVEAIMTARVHNEHGVRDLLRIIDYCDANDVDAEWLEALRLRTEQLGTSYVEGSSPARRRIAVHKTRRTLRRLRMRARRLSGRRA